MNNLVNSVRLIGNLGTNPEVKTFNDGKKLVKLTLATSEQYKNSKGDKETITTWHSLTCWNQNAEFASKYLGKGDMIAVDGKLRNRSYEDKQGVKHWTFEIEVHELQILKRVAREQTPPTSPTPAPFVPPTQEPIIDDLPF